MNRKKTIFNATMALIVRGAAAGLIFFYWDLPYRQALTEPGAAFAADTVNAGLALFITALFGALVLSGLYVFIRMLTGANVIADPAHWREQAAVRRGFRVTLFLVLLVFWAPEFLSLGEWISSIRGGENLATDESLGVIWVAATAYFTVSFLLGLFGPVPAHVRGAAAGSGDWTDFLEDFLPGGDAYADLEGSD